MASLLFSPNVTNSLSLDLNHQFLLQPWKLDKTLPTRPHFSKPKKMITSALVQDVSAAITETVETVRELSGFEKEHKFEDPEEDPRLLREIWKEIQGSGDWEGLLDPMNSHLRREIIRYGEFAQSSYDSFDFDPHSKYCGSCKYSIADFFEKMDMSHFGYRMCRNGTNSNLTEAGSKELEPSTQDSWKKKIYLYATSNINLEKFFQRSNSIRSIWSPHANWMGYVAVTEDEEEIKRLGRRDILIVWRGTVTYLEWIHDLKNILQPAHFRDNPHVQIESGFYDLYTTKEENCKFCSFSAREQVLAEVKRLVEKFKGEELSITVTGHSLGGALALLSAYDIAEMRLNVVHDESLKPKKIPISVISYGSPRVGNLKFKERCDELGVKQIRVVNVHDKVPTMPGLIANEKNKLQKYLEDTIHFPWSYAHVGTELALDQTHSRFLKPNTDVASAHNLEALLHLVDGYHGKGRKFRLVTKRDIALVNKDSDLLKSEYGVPPKWRQDHNKGMVRNNDGRWVRPDRARIEAHPPDTAHHFAQAMKIAQDPSYDFFFSELQDSQF